MPVTAQNMNYTSVITVGLMTLTGIWWFIRGRTEYRGPRFSFEAAKDLTSAQTHKENGDAIIATDESTGASLNGHGRVD